MGKKKLQKTLRKIGTVAKIGINTGKLFKRVSNPIKLAKAIGGAARGKGFVLPGSKYIGPGNPMNRGSPKSKADALAYQHDVDYADYLKAGVKKKHLYTGYSDADARLMKESKKHLADDPSAIATYAGMGAKKLLNKTGLTKRIRDKDIYAKSGGKPAEPNIYQANATAYNSKVRK